MARCALHRTFRTHTFSETFEVGNCGDMIQHRDSKIFCLFIFLCAFVPLAAALAIVSVIYIVVRGDLAAEYIWIAPEL